jgi:hypothetical protein
VQTADLLILKQVMIIRKEHRIMGTRKLYDMLQPFMMEHGIKMGRESPEIMEKLF